MEIGEKIKQLRIEKRISQKELATRLGLNQPNIVYFESRGNAITVEQCINIAAALEVSIKSLLFDDIDYTVVPNSKEEIALLEKQIELYENRINQCENTIEMFKELLAKSNEIINYQKDIIDKFKSL